MGLKMYEGTPGVYLQWNDTLLNSVVSLDSAVLMPHGDNFIQFSSGAAGLVKGYEATGGTSGAKMMIMGVVVTSGTLAGGDAQGVIFVKRTNNTPAVSGESLTYCTTLSGYIWNPGYNQQARALDITVERNSINFTEDGSTPTNSAGTPPSMGHVLSVDTDYRRRIVGWGKVKNFKMINSVSGALARVNITVLY